MYSKAHVKELTSLFWTSFGKYMGKHTPQYQKNTKWVNYRTGVKSVYLRLRADKKSCEIAIEIQNPEDSVRQLFYEQFLELKKVFESTAGEWIWEPKYFNEFGHEISKIYLQKSDVHLYIQDTWKDMFQFYEQHIVDFDEFWSEFNEILKQLED
jgi:hypothetical protein